MQLNILRAHSNNNKAFRNNPLIYVQLLSILDASMETGTNDAFWQVSSKKVPKDII